MSEEEDGKTLRVELTESEKENWWADEAIRFSVDDDKNVAIHAEWDGMDELWGDGCSIVIPPRVWALAAPWIAERVA